MTAEQGQRTRIAVLFGGQSEEHPISCLSAASVLAALDSNRYDIQAIGITQDGQWHRVSNDPGDWVRRGGELPHVEPVGSVVHLTEIDVDVVFPVLHGPFGEDGTVQGALELLGIPYVGSGVLASALTMDKQATKRMLGAYGLTVGPFVAFEDSDWVRRHDAVVASIEDTLEFPVFVKPARMGSSIGITKVSGIAELDSAIEEARAHDSHIVIEQSIEGAREIECGVIAGLGHELPTASVCAEIIVGGDHEFYDFDAKYIDNSTTLVVPADLSETLAKELGEIAVRAFGAVGADGLARVDFFVGPDSTIYLNEINTMPGFTEVSMFPKMWQATGMTYPQLVDHLVAVALDRRSSARSRD